MVWSLAMLCGIVLLAGCGGSSTTNVITQQGQRTPDDLGTPSATLPNPCNLVSLSEARAITGGAVTSRVEAPLGPTCIYGQAGSRSEITVAIESQSLSQVTRQLRTLEPLTVQNRRGYCGRVGSEILFLQLSGRRLLRVAAPCAIARQFAVQALSRIRT